MIISTFQSLPHCALDIFTTGKRVKHEGYYRLEILEEAINLNNKQSTKDRRKLNETVKHCLK